MLVGNDFLFLFYITIVMVKKKNKHISNIIKYYTDGPIHVRSYYTSRTGVL